MHDLTLYTANPSRGLSNQWMLAELGLPYQLIVLNLDNEEHKSPEYLSINNMGKVPTLVHGETIVTESAAINLYLADLTPDKGLSISTNSPLRGSYLRWCFFAPVTAEPSLMAKALKLSHPDYQPFAELETVAETLSLAIGEKDYIVGDKFTCADVAIGSFLYWGFNLIPVLPKHDELVRYWNNIAERPAWLSLFN